ncbi:MAG: hypothetical protein VB049_00300 [Candidatus Pelethousia sp.]|nr:hypothetical protein [Candidatus Pelethousia sp.]
MANTSALKAVTNFAIQEVAKDLKIELAPQKIYIGNEGVTKKFDGVSLNKDIIVKVINHSGYTSGNKLPTGKIRNTFADCYFLSLTKANSKILAVTNQEFYKIFNAQSKGLLGEIQLKYIELPDELKEIARKVSQDASREMS